MGVVHTVRVPGRLLLDRQLPDSAKLLWMTRRLGAPGEGAWTSPGPLAARSGLARHTVRRGLARLADAGWWPAGPSGGAASTGGGQAARQRWASVPDDLMLDRRVGTPARVLYGSLQLTPGFRRASGQFTYAELGALLGASPNKLKRAVRALLETGWLLISQRNKFSPILFTLRNPAAERREAEAARAKRRLETAPFKGEALMREYLSLLVDSDEFEDNATPGFLVNPFTGEELQYDRYYPPGVAFEFNGPQHYGPTARYKSEADAVKQRGRDYIKIGISVTRGVRLVVVHPEDLTLAVMQEKVGGLLPLRSLDGHGPLIDGLKDVSEAYQKKARREGW